MMLLLLGRHHPRQRGLRVLCAHARVPGAHGVATTHGALPCAATGQRRHRRAPMQCAAVVAGSRSRRLQQQERQYLCGCSCTDVSGRGSCEGVHTQTHTCCCCTRLLLPCIPDVAVLLCLGDVFVCELRHKPQALVHDLKSNCYLGIRTLYAPARAARLACSSVMVLLVIKYGEPVGGGGRSR